MRRFTVPHAVRCVAGSLLRVMIWGSVLNVVLAGRGRVEGFWAAKVMSVGELLLACWAAICVAQLFDADHPHASTVCAHCVAVVAVLCLFTLDDQVHACKPSQALSLRLPRLRTLPTLCAVMVMASDNTVNFCMQLGTMDASLSLHFLFAAYGGFRTIIKHPLKWPQHLKGRLQKAAKQVRS